MAHQASPTILGLQPSFGFGDRLGCATPGHLRALSESGTGISGVFAQQSIREMDRTKRSPQEVLASASKALEAAAYQEPWGADADHLKTLDDVDRTAQAGFVFFTIDPSDFVNQQADLIDARTLDQQFPVIRSEISWVDDYVGQRLRIKNGPTLEFTPVVVARAALKYAKAITHAVVMARHIAEVSKRLETPFEIELSVDETEHPTSLEEHYIIANECRESGLECVSLAPRFLGDFEKGVDYKGDLERLQHSLLDHAAIARYLGPYKLGLHSGSDKLSIYPLLAKATEGLFHVKTAGTSYLEALRVVATHDIALFREIISFSRSKFDVDRATYHVSASLEKVPEPEQVTDDRQLIQIYLEQWDEVPEGRGFTQPGRQILHCTFGSVLNDKRLGVALRDLLAQHPETYEEVLATHFAGHLNALQC